MEPELVMLVAASFAFVGGHFALSHPLRAPLVGLVGEKLFPAVYSVVAAAAMLWMYLAFRDAPITTPLWSGFDDASWIVASVVTLIAMVLFAGSFARNPAMPMPGAEKAARTAPHGVFKVTRHPMMWGFALWAVAHLIAAPTARTLVVASTVLVLALVGSRLQDRKKRVLMGEAWSEWESRTTYWPRLGALFSAGLMPWLVGTALWLAFTYAHIHAAGWDAGIWRWL